MKIRKELDGKIVYEPLSDDSVRSYKTTISPCGDYIDFKSNLVSFSAEIGESGKGLFMKKSSAYKAVVKTLNSEIKQLGRETTKREKSKSKVLKCIENLQKKDK